MIEVTSLFLFSTGVLFYLVTMVTAMTLKGKSGESHLHDSQRLILFYYIDYNG